MENGTDAGTDYGPVLPKGKSYLHILVITFSPHDWKVALRPGFKGAQHVSR